MNLTRILTILTVLVIVSTVLIGLGKQIANSLEAGKRMDVSISELNDLEKENRVLKEQYNYVQSSDYIEGVARDKLNMAKSDETVLIIPQSAIEKAIEDSKPKSEVKTPNWQGWLKLFLH